MSYLTNLDEWQELQLHHRHLRTTRIQNLFNQNTNRLSEFTKSLDGIQINYAHNLITDQTLFLLFNLAKKLNIKGYISSLFACEQVNFTERRAALHMALRSPQLFSGKFYNRQMSQDISTCFDKIKKISYLIRQGEFKSHNGKPIRSVLNIGIGGSDLGPKMVTEVLAPYADSMVSIDYVSNLDPWHIASTLSRLNPEETLLIISSKSFTTLETLTNAKVAFEWLGSRDAIEKQCIAITANPEQAVKFGISKENILPMWDWVGGRYSLWSAIGLTIAICIGYDGFLELLNGASLVDQHVANASLEENIPLILALIDVWHANFCKYSTRAIIPYAEQLKFFTDYCQQLIMESNGKSVDVDGNLVNYETCPIIWGGIGTNSQHAFHQLLMQGTQNYAVDFICSLKSSVAEFQSQHDKMLMQLKAQSMALMEGNKLQERSLNRKVFGNNAHTVFTLNALTPKILGSLISLYEHRTVLNAALWRINPFDQYGVELGKVLIKNNLVKAS